MITPRLFLCGGAVPTGDRAAGSPRRTVLELTAHGSAANVNIQLEDVAKVFLRDLSPRIIDLLEIASYVFAADCSTSRGTGWADEATTEPWSRDFRFLIPVRDLPFWSQPDVQRLLRQILAFLSDDKYDFEFQQLTEDQPRQTYVSFGDFEEWPFYGAERVIMFSGGLDSLARVVETASSGSNLLLVSHRSVATMDARQRRLVEELRRRYPNRLIHVPVWVNKAKKLGREHTQRTRSFLYAALGTVVADSAKARGVRFFENGVVSLNLPIADEVVRARASRTTHPIVLSYLSELFSLLLGRSFVVDNPYLFKKKTDVVSTIAANGGAGLIPRTCSCAHTGFFQSKTQWHCGTCSQCIDRRTAILAAGQAQHDAETDYVSDVFTGPRRQGYEQNMAVDYVRHAFELNRMSETEMSAKFNLELSRALRPFPNRRSAAENLVALHKEHGEAVYAVVTRQMQNHVNELVAGSLEPTSMLAMIAGQRHLEPAWTRYCARVRELLTRGIPIACRTHKPKDEPHLQELCDAILKADGGELIREFPFMRWSSVLTKPDWSVEALRLVIEAKYVRKKEDLRPISEALAADVTKYGDNERRILFVIYDPSHLVVDEHAFSEPFLRRGTMIVCFVR